MGAVKLDAVAMAQGIMADLGRSRQEELPLSTVQGRGPSFIQPRMDDSLRYGREVKSALGQKWSTKIEDEESEQMHGLANLNARPWATNGTMPHSGGVFQTAQPPTAVPPPAAVQAPRIPNIEQAILALDGRVINNAATLPTVSKVTIFVLPRPQGVFLALSAGAGCEEIPVEALRAPGLQDNRCIIKSRPGRGRVDYTIEFSRPESARKLAKTLCVAQEFLVNRQMPKTPALLPPTGANQMDGSSNGEGAATAKRPRDENAKLSTSIQPAVSKLLDDDKSPADAANAGVLNIADVLNDLIAVARSAYYRFIGGSNPLLRSEPDTSHSGMMAECMQTGHLDSEVEPAPGMLLDIMRFLTAFKLKVDNALKANASPAMNELREVGTPAKAAKSIKYSSTEILEMRREFKKTAPVFLIQESEAKQEAPPVVSAPAQKVAKSGGLANSRWAK